MNQQKTLFLFTISFPYGEGESFIKDEFSYLSASFDKINIITSAKKTNEHGLGQHVNVHALHDIIKNANRRSVLIKNFFLINAILYKEFLSCRSKGFFIKGLAGYCSTLINACICADYIVKLPDFDEDACFYSFWMNNHALTLSVLKKKNKIRRFLFRVHGYDLVLERWPHKYIAFQETCHHYADRILTVSKKSLDYFRNTYKYASKAGFAYLGTEDKGENLKEHTIKENICLVSCSNIIPLKRLHLIIAILKETRVEVSWVHFGAGYLHKEIIDYAKQLPSNIKASFMGQVSQNELFSFYRNNRIDFFINVSDSEGLPFTIIEATSFGIPIIATDVGGTSEIVNSQTGILLEENFSPKAVAQHLNDFHQSSYKTEKFRAGVRNFWRQNFSANIVYPRFIIKELLRGNETI